MTQPPSDPTQPLSPYIATPEVQFGPAPEQKKSKRGLIAAGVAAVVVIGGGGAGFAAYQKLAQHGAQPDTVLPSTAIAFARLDLDPTAGQKISATRFLSKLPQTTKSGDSVDVKKTIWSWASKSNPDLATIDYAQDVEPWLGDRAALALLPGGTDSDPNVVLALETTDTTKAKAGIDKIAKTDPTATGDYELTVKDDYVLVTHEGKGAGVLSDLAKGSLATNTTYTSDLGKLGDTGVASIWFDGKGVADLIKSSSTSSSLDLGQLDQVGSFAAALRFDPDYAEVTGITQGGSLASGTVAAPSTGGATTLPDDTIAAVQLNGLGDAVTKQWATLAKSLPSEQVQSLETQLNVKLPDDLATLLGSSLTLSLPKQDLGNLGGDTPPTIGAKIATADTARADQIVTGVTAGLGADGLLQHEVADGKLYLSTTPDYLAALKETGTLGSTATFTKAVADPGSASQIVFANLQELSSLYANDVPGDYKDLVSSLSAVGLSARVDGSGSASFSLRLTGK